MTRQSVDVQPAGSAGTEDAAQVSYRGICLWPAPDKQEPALVALDRGEHVTVLERGNGEMSRVRLATGMEGWVETVALRYGPLTLSQPERPAPAAALPRLSPPHPAQLRTIHAPAYDRSRELAYRAARLLELQIHVSLITFVPIGLMFLAFLFLSEGLWKLGALGWLGVGLAQVVVGLLFIVRYTQWIYATVRATREFGVRPVNVPPGLAAALLFIPVFGICFLWPFAVLQVFWSASDPRLVGLAPGAPRPRAITWTPWGLLAGIAFNSLLSLLALLLLASASILAALFVMMISVIFGVCLISWLKSMIEEISARLFEQYDALRRLPEPSTGTAGFDAAALA